MANPVDADLAKALRVAKKKPRNFAIIAKGPNVLKLLVQKKPIKDGALMKAKKEVHGNAIVKGVVTGGNGPELVFQVLEEPSVGLVKLRAFITNNTKLTLKPQFEVVPEVVEIDDDTDDSDVDVDTDDEGVDETTDASPAEPTTAAERAPEPPPPPPPAGGEAADFAKRLQALKPSLSKVQSADTSVSEQVKTSAAAMAGLAKAGDFVQATSFLGELETLVRQGMEQLAAQAVAAGDPGALFAERLKALMPDIKQAIASGTTTGQEIKLRTSEAGVFAQKRDFPRANELLDQVENLLKSEARPADAEPAGGSAADAEPADDNLATAFATRQARLEPGLLAAQKLDVEKAPKLAAVWAYALGKAEAGDYANANKALDGLEKAMAETRSAAGAQPASEEPDQSESRVTDINSIWTEALDSVHDGLNKLGTALRQSKDPELDRIADLGLGAITKRLQVGLRVALMNYMQAAPQDRVSFAKKVDKQVEEFRSFLSSDQRLSLIDDNPFGIDVGVRTRLGAALDRIERAIAQAA